MATLVSTGQITIVDNNDARPITAFIAASGVTQQIFSKDESTTTYVPDWATTPLVLTAKVYVGAVGSATEVAASLSNRKWSTDLVTSLGNATTFTISTNMAEAAPTAVYYFEGDYTDSVTGLVSHVIAQISIGMVKTGTNAVFIQVKGQNVIEEATGSTKNTVTLTADLVRAAGVDDTGITYQWFQSPHAAADQIDGNLASVTTKYGFRDTAATNAGVVGAIGAVKTGAGGTTTAISLTNMPDGGWVDVKSITIHETAVVDIAVFLVKAKDALGTIYQQYFTVYDISDPYDTRLVSTSGDKLQNGVGSTTIFPRVFYGAVRVADVTNWSFTWYYYDKDGLRAAFIDTTRTALAGGRTITVNTSGTSAVLTYSGTAITFAAGDIIKVVTPAGLGRYYEVASGTGNTVTIRTPVTNTWLNFTNFPAPAAANDVVNGKLYVCTASGIRTTAGGATETVAQIVVTGDEIDAKGTIMCESNRP